MNLLKFKSRYGKMEYVYEVEIDFEYTSDLEKRITSVILYRPDINRQVTVPWNILKPYLNGKIDGVFANASGLRIHAIDKGIMITDSCFFNLLIHNDHANLIKIAAKKIKENISTSVERILGEFTVQEAVRGAVQGTIQSV